MQKQDEEVFDEMLHTVFLSAHFSISLMHSRQVYSLRPMRGMYVTSGTVVDARRALAQLKRHKTRKRITPVYMLDWLQTWADVKFVPEASYPDPRDRYKFKYQYDPRTSVFMKLEIYAENKIHVLCGRWLARKLCKHPPNNDSDTSQRDDDDDDKPKFTSIEQALINSWTSNTGLDIIGNERVAMDFAEQILAFRKCVVCETDNSRFKCGACMFKRYCSGECQRYDWTVHHFKCADSKIAGDLLQKLALGNVNFSYEYILYMTTT